MNQKIYAQIETWRNWPLSGNYAYVYLDGLWLKRSWRGFLRHLKERGLVGVQLFISDSCLGLVESLGEFHPQAAWQRCIVHFYHNVWTATPHGKVAQVTLMLKAIHAQEDKAAAQRKAVEVVTTLKALKLDKAV